MPDTPALLAVARNQYIISLVKDSLCFLTPEGFRACEIKCLSEKKLGFIARKNHASALKLVEKHSTSPSIEICVVDAGDDYQGLFEFVLPARQQGYRGIIVVYGKEFSQCNDYEFDEGSQAVSAGADWCVANQNYMTPRFLSLAIYQAAVMNKRVRQNKGYSGVKLLGESGYFSSSLLQKSKN